MKSFIKHLICSKFTFLIVQLWITAGCAHEVYSLEIETEKRNVIVSELNKQCEKSCVIEKCWSETQSIQFCEVSFSFTTSSTKENILNETSEALSKKGLQVGFCGRDSVGTELVAAFFRGMGSGMAASATGGSVAPAVYGSSSSSVRTVASVEINDLLAKACDSTPVRRVE